ncbi:DUF726 domain-containing protein [Paracoccus methylarcula]|nr:DUF726 domain-containing protein [Paracoccus methylarcula]
MPVVKLNADSAMPPGLRQQARALPEGAPIIAMIHGYRYSPSQPANDPHRHILALDPQPDARRVLSWPRALGFGTDLPGEGLALAFGWEARGRLGRAYRQAGEAGAALARTISELAECAARPVALIGHSLGARVALQALHHADPGSIGRMILLTGAEFRDAAAAAMDSAAGRRAEILNVTSRENDLFDFAIEIWLGHGQRQALGFGLDAPRRNWIDLQIDHGGTLDALRDLSFPVDRTPLRLSHWTPYLREGLFDFYRTALGQPWALPMPMLRARLPGRIEPRWSRLLAPPAPMGGLRA